ncbi:MAG: hypothetical protein HKP58_01595 [Desulfatitalea sp.]|nr:hypothetical protein [Desulfatitalea sp.]NNJ99081.1 hypothetical protein [Desulfatitalea sp.]
MNRKMIGILMVLAALVIFTAPAHATSMGDVDIHGFISQGFIASNEYNYLSHKSTDGSFEFNEVGVNFSKKIADRLRVGIQLFSRDLGDTNNNKVTLDWAYGDYRQYNWLGIRAGRMKTPLGLYNEIRDIDTLRTNIIMPQGIYPDLIRETTIALNGFGLYGNIDLRSVGSLDYLMITGGQSTDNEGGLEKFYNSFLKAQGQPTTILNGTVDARTSYCGGLRWDTPLDGLRIGYSFMDSAGSIPIKETISNFETELDSKFLLQVFSVEYTWNNLILAGEYYSRKNDTTSVAGDSTTTEISYYVSGSYRFNDLFTLGAYYSIYYHDEDDKDGDNLIVGHMGREKDLAATLRFDLNPFWVFKVEGHYVDGTAWVASGDNPNSDWSEDTWYYGVAKMTFSF